MSCPCGSHREFEQCCGPLLGGARKPLTAEELMRARYTAYTRKDIGYIARTFAPESLGDFDAGQARAWAGEASWRGLRIVSIEKGRALDHEGVVEFVATYQQRGATIAHHERSRFRKTAQGEWLFVEGATTRSAEAGEHNFLSDREQTRTVPSAAPKVGRNDLCPCGSGKKYKACCRA
jgi:SEC-C motif-containing protein